MREYFLKTERIGFSIWNKNDLSLAQSLWGQPDVTKYICKTGVFTSEEIEDRLNLEIQNYEKYQIQYFPLFQLETQELIGCCGLRTHKEDGALEVGCHLRKAFWGNSYATEATLAVIKYGFEVLKCKKIMAGHHPDNVASSHVLPSLGFEKIGQEYYIPTGLMHPLYQIVNPNTL